MRFDDWDVILFPKNSPVPVQEFKTACYVSTDEYGRQVPTLTSYISSLPPQTPFRISIHSWATAAKPSAVIESRRKTGQKIVYAVQVVVDGTRVFRDFFDIASKWPQEIAYEKQCFHYNEQSSSQQKQALRFPPFNFESLKQSVWEARDPKGRIKITLSEQLISKTDSPGEPELGSTNDLVCFAFQHAPKDVLEQAGISWPIRNPLYLPNAYDRALPSTETSPSFDPAPNRRFHNADIWMQSPLPQSAKPTFPRSRAGPHSHMPPMMHFPHQALGSTGNGLAGVWDGSFVSFGDNGEDTSIEAWPAHRNTSGSTSHRAIPDHIYQLSRSSRHGPHWVGNMLPREKTNSSGWGGQHVRPQKDKQSAVAPGEEQLGQIMDAGSPLKATRQLPHGFHGLDDEPIRRPPTAHTFYPPKMVAAPLIPRPSSAAIARKSSYSDFTTAIRNASNKLSPDKPQFGCPPSVSSSKENRQPSQLHLADLYPQTERIPSTHLLVQRGPIFEAMSHAPSVFLGMSHFDHSTTTDISNASTAHAPSTTGSVKSKKEGIASNSPPLPAQAVRHDQSLLPNMTGDINAAEKMIAPDYSKNKKNRTVQVEIIDLDPIDPSLDADVPRDSTKTSPFKATHKTASSMDSTDRLERTLFSALGEELGSFEHEVEMTGMGGEFERTLGGSMAQSDFSGTTLLNTTGSESESAVKRKRQGTLGGERDRSPKTKREKGRPHEGVEGVEGVDEIVLSLRGD